VSVAVWVGVGLLGGVGACARVLLELAVRARTGAGWPWGHLVVNVSGAFALGVLAGAGVRGDARLLAGTALLGAYTTFSAWMLDADILWRDGRRAAAAANVLGSLALGLAAAALGQTVAS
jgi:CrcB protein